MAHDAVFAMLDPDKGTLWESSGAHYVVPAALLLELTHAGRLSVTGSGRTADAAIEDFTGVGDPELDITMRRWRRGRHRVSAMVRYLPSFQPLVERLVESGELVQFTEKKLGLVAVRRLRAASPAEHAEVIGRIRSALLGESRPDDRTTLLIAALGLGVPVKRFVPKDRVREAKLRAEEFHGLLSAEEQAVLSGVRAARDSEDTDSGVSNV